MPAVLEDAAVKAVVATGSAVRDVDHSDDCDLVVVFGTERPVLSRSPISARVRSPHAADARSALICGSVGHLQQDSCR